jgi:hypothetical protein
MFDLVLEFLKKTSAEPRSAFDEGAEFQPVIVQELTLPTSSPFNAPLGGHDGTILAEAINGRHTRLSSLVRRHDHP